jgi:hypothetical protein
MELVRVVGRGVVQRTEELAESGFEELSRYPCIMNLPS